MSETGAYLPHGMDAYLQETHVPGELLVFVRQPARGCKRAMLARAPEEIQELIFEMVNDILEEHAQELGPAHLPDNLSGNHDGRPS